MKILCLLALVFFLSSEQTDASRIGVSVPTNNLGLVAHWTFDGPDMVSNVTDRSGRGNHGYLLNFNGTTTVAGRRGQAIDIKKVANQGVVIPHNSSLNPSSITISFWIKDTGTTMTERLLNKSGDYIIRTTDTSNWRQLQAVRGDYFASTPGSHELNVWEHWVFTADSTKYKWYKNGTLDASFDYDWGTPGDVSDLYISGVIDQYDGLLDDIRMYNRVLSAGEIERLYNQGSAKIGATPRGQSGTGLSAGLIAHWTFDGPEINWNSGAVTDRSGNGNTGYVVGMSTSTSPTKGKVGQALDFNGWDSFINIPYNSSFDSGTGELSLSLWFNTASTAGSLSIFSKEVTALSDNGIGLNVTYQGKLAGWIYNERVDSTMYVNDGKWHHVLLRRNSSTTMELYVDGIYDATAPIPSGISAGSSFAHIRIGANHYWHPSYAYDGLIDDVRLYNRSLSATEIRQLYNLGGDKIATTPRGASGQGLSAGLVGHWTFDGPEINWNSGAVTDRSGNGNTGYVVNMSTSTSPTKGKLGQALNLVGSGYINVPASASIDDLTTITTCAWIHPNRSVIGYPIIIRKTSNAEAFGWDFYLRSGEVAGYGIGTSFIGGGFDYKENRASGTVRLREWSHVCMTQNGDGSANMQMYVNGVAISALDIGDTGTRASDAGQSLRIGSGGGTGGYLNCPIDDVRVYNRVLSADEIRQLYNLAR